MPRLWSLILDTLCIELNFVWLFWLRKKIVLFLHIFRQLLNHYWLILKWLTRLILIILSVHLRRIIFIYDLEALPRLTTGHRRSQILSVNVLLISILSWILMYGPNRWLRFHPQLLLRLHILLKLLILLPIENFGRAQVPAERWGKLPVVSFRRKFDHNLLSFV